MAEVDFASLKLEDTLVSFSDGILVITINRAKQFNTFGQKLIQELIQLFSLADKDDRVRVVILTADPKAPAYCAGADISGGWDSIANNPKSKNNAAAHRDEGGQVAMAIYHCRKITIAAVNGSAAGVGVTGLQLPFDFRFVWSGAKISLPFVRRGIAPEATSAYLLPRLIGHSKAAAIFLSGGTFKADSPVIKDLYFASYPSREEVLPAALAFAKELAVNASQPSITYAKGLLHHPGDSVEESHLYDSRIIKMLSASRDAKEGAMAFMKRREPKFQDTNSENLNLDFYPWWSTTDVKPKL
ncbi:peroxisomal enoyl-CoA-hydratase [Flagelloscypha sp. PMI_526]|nr:peroxisomal enoyl-CoA-hydratase [Flagelloscypha sp. PMI_526]